MRLLGKHFETRQAQAADEPAVRKCAEDVYEQYVAAIGKKPAPMVADFAALIASGFVHVAVEGQADVIDFIVFFKKVIAFYLKTSLFGQMQLGWELESG